MRNKKLQVWLPLVFSIVMIAGMTFGYKLHQQTGSTRGFFVKDRRTALQEALDLIRNRYVDAVGMDSIQNNAMQEMMEHLDPHSVFIPASDVSEANESITGNFDGIGVEFNVFADTVHVLYVIPEGPGDRAGLRVGDKIIRVDDSLIVSKTLSSEAIRRMIRGKAGTDVKLTLYRGNATESVAVKRGTIPVPSVEAHFMIDSITGYIKLTRFSEATYREFMQSLEALQAKGMKQLIFDLRNNSGGLLTAAVSIADEFLEGQRLIVYTEGEHMAKQEFRARRPGLFEKGKLTILINELSASASEVIAGALQDWDRATIIGRRSFGKGLVQEQYQLSDGSAIRLTVARYYTPVGRSIQRPYEQGRKIYMEQLSERLQSGEVSMDTVNIAAEQKFKTKGGRTVYGGGGIMPDIYIAADTSSFSENVSKLYLDGRFNNFVYTYFIQNAAHFQRFNSPADFAANFRNLEDAWNHLVIYAKRDGIDLSKIPAADKVEIQNQMKAYLARFRWRTQGFYEIASRNDKTILAAREAMR